MVRFLIHLWACRNANPCRLHDYRAISVRNTGLSAAQGPDHLGEASQGLGPGEIVLEFKIFTNALKAYETEKGDLYVSGTTSSTIRDLHGDEMSMDALKEMQRTAEDNMTVFLNHNYNVPEDLFGSVTASRIVKRFDEANGQEVYDLDIDVRVVGEDENPEAMRAFRAIKRGVKLGLSIGARVEKASRKMNKDSGEESILIEKIRLMEASVVGIPANQRSYLSSAIKSIKSAGVDLDAIEDHDSEKAASKLKTGDFVQWGSSGGSARGKIVRIVRNGKIDVPNSDFTVTGTPEDPAALIRVYSKSEDGWKPSETLVGHKLSTLRKIEALKSEDVSIAKVSDLIDSWKAIEIEGQSSSANDELVKALGSILAELRELALMASDQPVADDYDPESLASALYAANEALLVKIVSAFNVATRLSQQGIANFLAERQDMHQKWSWQLRASLAEEEEDTGAGGIDVEDTGLEIVQPGGKPKEQEKSMDIEKKTRVTVTVSTDGEEKQPASAAVAPSAPAADATDVEDIGEVKASATPDEKELAEEDVEIVEDDLEEPVVESERARAIEALEALGAKLVDAEADDLKSLSEALTALTKSEGDESSVQPETAEAEVVAEVAEEAPAAEVVVEAVPASLEEVESIAKSALDAASAAQEEVTALAAKVTELAEAKAKVEGELSKALELIERISALGVGRKSADTAKVLVRAPEAAPWLNPYVQRALEAQDEE